MGPIRASTEVTTFVCTYNSEATLRGSLASVRTADPDSSLVVIDHESRDKTLEIAAEFGARIVTESMGLGHARQLAFEMARTELMAFVDSDVRIVNRSFFTDAIRRMQVPGTGAIVGMAVGHRFAFGLPAGLLMLRTSDFIGKVIPNGIDARETYFIQKRLRQRGLKICYMGDAMVHDSGYRRFKPEWEGANTRLACGLSLVDLGFAFKVIVLISLNSRRLKNAAYIPIFMLKFMRGFSDPQTWRRLERV